ncbi:hypothetical protein CDAR_366081 [Caerostris darwini]|uniref:Uncharacterized protein n=1 Tax=Caerostris darwini TaxID=1538125 RepID=A0AAV4MQ27_9ARAC|nr:hypothetical protein CDAR_366081 [Caerostris darwini]
MFVFALLACVAVAQASFVPSYPVATPLVSNLPLVSNVGYPYGVVAPGLGFGFNNGFGIYDRRFNAFPLGYRGVLGYNGLLGGFNGLYYGLRK